MMFLNNILKLFSLIVDPHLGLIFLQLAFS